MIIMTDLIVPPASHLLYPGVAKNIDKLLSFRFTDEDGDEYSLAEMADPVKASGHCYDSALLVQQSGLIHGEGKTGEILRIVPEGEDDPDGWWHTAFSVPDHIQTDIVFDFTMRQFHPDLPFPYVGYSDQWVDIVEKYAGQGSLEFLW